MTRLFYASTLFGAMTLAAAIGDGRFGPREDRRILLVSNNAAIPEIIPSLDEAPGFAALRPLFDEVRSWNDIVAPLHPSDWRARIVEVPMLGRLLRSHLSLDDGLDELVLESIAVPPSRTLAGLVRDCPITVYSDGLMSYGPTRDPLPAEISGRITRLLHLDLVPGLSPLLLSEYGVPAEPLPDRAFLDVIERSDAGRGMDGLPVGAPMILGQYLSALDLVTAEEEAGLHAAMLRGLVARGARTVLFKPHPAGGRRHAQRLRETAGELGVELAVVAETVSAESCFAALRPALVVGCFSTALVTAGRHFGLAVATMGGELVLERLSPYENSNRIPATVVDALFPRLSADGSLEEPPPVNLPALVGAVGYCMRSEAYPGLREVAATYLDAHGPARYFKQRRLAALGLRPAAAVQEPGTLGKLRRRLARALPQNTHN
ncbi:polysialyltransferase family glycosyltransferase [Streptosporangium sp. NBC_01756]|uniref:polysialyltransferase family glycosyltransferase n=1 Tax=Streptosporangium sp. NBC_01756 TaxID=2975950 RepID=UPI002DDC7284|nr:polysialyltransferase family glycosyltransferase [Streptosporangium sp. NBC_01756]WSC85580.1 alpha-2,8-polysialyltransferase family protein [Streptosporangium sp. NBC_01756]